jgi:hypothetical protein
MIDAYKNHYTETMPYKEAPDVEVLQSLVDKGIILGTDASGDGKMMTLVYAHIIRPADFVKKQTKGICK